MSNNSSDCISFVETDKMSEYIDIVTRQTNYSREMAKLKLSENNYDYILVIKNYLGVSAKPKSNHQNKSVNQQIYSQMRYKLNSALDDYSSRKDEDKKIKNY